MTVGIRASFPLGVYRGHTSGYRHDSLPSPLRLHAALVAAAGDGTTAAERLGALERDEASDRALQWLEDNPPEYIELPEWATGVVDDRPFAYMDEGVIENAKTDPTRRKTARFIADSTALAGPIGWGWDRIPDEISAALDDLCADVPCLGETESPVVLEVSEIQPTHQRSASESPFASVAIRLAVPTTGRLGELDALYEKAQPAKSPTVSADKWTSTEKPKSPEITHDHTISLGYDRIGEAVTDTINSPWNQVIHISVDRDIEPADRVRWAVTLHRALVSALGSDANSAITGRYPEGVLPPANRMAIQYLDEDTMRLSNHAALGSGFALLVADDVLAEIAPVVDVVKRLYRGGAGEIRLGTRTLVSAADFWRSPAFGITRIWCAGAVVPETRRQKPSASRRWTLADSAMLSLGFVFRDRLGQVRSGPARERYEAIIERVEAAGVRVIQAVPIPDSDVARYAHKLPQGVVAQPYRLVVAPGGLLDETALIAIGQSRHLGGGLLVPMDLEQAVADVWGVGR